MVKQKPISGIDIAHTKGLTTASIREKHKSIMILQNQITTNTYKCNTFPCVELTTSNCFCTCSNRPERWVIGVSSHNHSSVCTRVKMGEAEPVLKFERAIPKCSSSKKAKDHITDLLP